MNAEGNLLQDNTLRGSDYIISCIGGKYVYRNAIPYVKDDSGVYSPYIFRDRYISLGYYEVANSEIGIRFYDYYNVIYTPNFKNIIVENERYEVYSWRTNGQGSWNTIGLDSGFQYIGYEINGNNVVVTRYYAGYYGDAEIKYIFRPGQEVKPIIEYNSNLAEGTIFKLEREYNGYNFTKVNGYDIVNGLNIYEDLMFFSGIQNLYVDERPSKRVWNNTIQDYTYFDTGFMGARFTTGAGNKIIFEYGNYTDSFVLDPTASIRPPTDDARVNRFAGKTGNNYDGQDLTAGYYFTSSNDWLTLCKFNLSIITNISATVTNSNFSLAFFSNQGAGTLTTYNSSDDSWNEATVTYATKPANNIALQSHSIGPGMGYHEMVDSTALDVYVQNTIDGGDGNVTFIVDHAISAGNNFETWNSTETASNEDGYPLMIIEYSLPSTSTTTMTTGINNDLLLMQVGLTIIVIFLLILIASKKR